MLLEMIFPQLVLATAASAAPLSPRQAGNATSGTIEWGPCTFNGTLPILCGSLAVPLDYSDSRDTRTINLDLVKVPAINGPVRGSIQFNFGGPGYESIRSLASLADYLQKWDITP